MSGLYTYVRVARWLLYPIGWRNKEAQNIAWKLVFFSKLVKGKRAGKPELRAYLNAWGNVLKASVTLSVFIAFMHGFVT